jgi:hypothetical protein
MVGSMIPCSVPLGILLACAPATGADIPRPEHPRPDFCRQAWLNLNGQWQFEIDNDSTGEQRGLPSGHDLAGSIRVPFCPESQLSGVAHTDFMSRVWYRRDFAVPAAMRGKRLLLHFEAVDWHAKVWLNGVLLGEHKGGYTPFALEATAAIREGDNELVVSAEDNTRSGDQATGKQSHEPGSYGCVYTRTTGIWQTVWLEAVGDSYVRDFVLTPDPDTGTVHFQAEVAGPSQGLTLRLQLVDQGKVVAEATVPAAGRTTLASLTVENPKLWWPGKPYLYDVRIALRRGGKVVDEVETYSGFRKVHIDGYRFLINHKPVFQRLVLDQGFYPDGIYTAPSDEALRRDIELSIAAGFNGARLHQKVFEPRFLYWADKLGYIVWGEFPDWGVNRESGTAVGQLAIEWKEAVQRDRNHPSIVGWCPLNEVWGGSLVAFAQHLLTSTRLMDPTRPLLDGSGGTHFDPETEVYDYHDYDQNPATFRARFTAFLVTGDNPPTNARPEGSIEYKGVPYFVSEYGGTAIAVKRDGEAAWGYGSAAQDIEAFAERYRGLTEALLDHPRMFAFCYTQLTDVEQEQNGVYHYDRTPKYDVKILHDVNTQPAAYERDEVLAALQTEVLVPTSDQTPQTWRYTTAAPSDDWFAPTFDDSGWQQGAGGFGTATTPGAVVGTEWNSDDIWLRRTVEGDAGEFAYAFLRIHHDEDAEVYLNGERIASLAGFQTGYSPVDVTDAFRAAWRPGENTLAIHCHQTEGGQFVDAGFTLVR